MQGTTAMKAAGGRAASRERRSMLVQGKAALPRPSERSRGGARDAEGSAVGATPVSHAASASAAAATPVATALPPAAAAVPGVAPTAVQRAASGREMSRARRQAMVQGKSALRQFTAAAPATAAAPSAASMSTSTPVSVPAGSAAPQPAGGAGSARMAAQALRAARARYGRGAQPAPRPSGRVRAATSLNYAPKVTPSETYAGGKVTGVRIGRGMNVTGDERGSVLQVTGSQYIGKEAGFQPREGGIKVGASRTAGGLVVTGTQVRSKVSVTGDEYASGLRITGEADQDLGDDLLDRRESGAYTSMQFQRQHNPHGHTVFGTNLGRSARAVGSRERSRDRAVEFTDSGLSISGTAVGRSVNVTGDEPGACRAITGDQYLMPATRQALCATGNGAGARAGNAFMRGTGGDPVTGAKVVESETWSHQRVTGVDVEHNDQVTGDEYGVCSAITGTPYVGPGQYQAVCGTGPVEPVAPTAGCRVTGDTPLNVDHVTGTQRGSARSITGTPYYRETVHDEQDGDRIAQIDTRFSVRSPQREAQLRAEPDAADAPTAAGRITGSFAVGHGKITGNQEFIFNPRPKGERAARSRLTGEGRMDGPAITGGAWSEHGKVTGTEGYIATERNPSQRAGKPQGFANATVFKSEGKHEPARQLVTGMVGWSAKSAAKVTLSGGAQG